MDRALPEESIYEFLERRKRELESRLSVLESQANLVRTELTAVYSSSDAIGPVPEGGVLGLGHVAMAGLKRVVHVEGEAGIGRLPEPLGGLAAAANIEFGEGSIRELVLAAFKANKGFKLYGASNANLREFIKDAFGRDIDRQSLSPALSRMRDSGLLMSTDGQKWKLVPNE